MIPFDFYYVFITGINRIHILSVLGLHEIVALSHHKQAWNEARCDMINRVKLFNVHPRSTYDAFPQKFLYYHRYNCWYACIMLGQFQC